MANAGKRWKAVSRLASALGLVLGGVTQLSAEGSVQTLGGGPWQGNPVAYGWRDGVTATEAQFHTPSGLAMDPTGRFLYVADRDNGALRVLDLSAGLTRTVVRGLSQPVGVAVNSHGEILVLEYGNGTSGRAGWWDRFGNLLGWVAVDLPEVTAVTLDGEGQVWVTCGSNVVLRIGRQDSNVVARVLEPGVHLSGIVVLTNGWIALADQGLHGIWVMDPTGQSVVPWTGFNGSGDRFGGPAYAQFRSPGTLARAGGGIVLVADTGNHRVKQILPDGTCLPFYGVSQEDWLPGWPWPGWYDGELCDHGFGSCAEARSPVGVVVAANGDVYTAETYYHVIRHLQGTGLTGPEPLPRSQDPVDQVAPPEIEPAAGYYPMGYRIQVRVPRGEVFYTVDGSDPTTNSLPVLVTNGMGWIDWRYADRDLTSLRVRAFVGTQASAVTSGRFVGTNAIGVPAWMNQLDGGVGATVVIPVVMNLRAGERVRSFQYRLEVIPEDGAPGLEEPLQLLSLSSNDFVRLVTPAQAGGVGQYQAWSYSVPGAEGGQGLLIAALGTNANVSFQGYAVVGLVAVRVPGTAAEGAQYKVQIVAPSATSDGGQGSIPVEPMPAVTIRVSNVAYLVGDTAPGRWYNAGLFGDGILDNADVNNVFYASMGVVVPPAYTDVYDAMDVFPVDTEGAAGGDGLIRYLDWQVVLRRAAGLDRQRWWRRWQVGGTRTALGQGGLTAAGAGTSSLSVGSRWFRQGMLGLNSVGEAKDGMTVRIPVWVRMYPGSSLQGLQFRLEVEARDGAVPLLQSLSWEAAAGVARPDAEFSSTTTWAGGWSMGRIGIPSGASNLLGNLVLSIPEGVPPGGWYGVRVERADGASDWQTAVNFETRAARVCVGTPAMGDSRVSEEWRSWAFGGKNDEQSADDADPDGDGLTNWQEFVAGTNPLEPSSRLVIRPLPRLPSREKGPLLQWETIPGRIYEVWAAPDPVRGPWELVESLAGTGDVIVWEAHGQGAERRFFRLRVRF